MKKFSEGKMPLVRVVPVIVLDCCGLAQHFVGGYEVGLASFTFFYQSDQNLMKFRSHIRNAGLPNRIDT
ncbi:MAG: hypothetical protein CL831_10800 [Crocinitomicaceae bacterium]|nr:hypothetical protein [Crocinitomicaceae bacterium]|tara:strand:+ start:304 stop:510 length:207 start_codon:yes stop_codon:yes gene_type:complete